MGQCSNQSIMTSKPHSTNIDLSLVLLVTFTGQKRNLFAPGGYSEKQTRKPILVFANFPGRRRRLAERTNQEVLSKEPPRSTRSFSDGAQIGSTTSVAR